MNIHDKLYDQLIKLKADFHAERLNGGASWIELSLPFGTATYEFKIYYHRRKAEVTAILRNGKQTAQSDNSNLHLNLALYLELKRYYP